MVLTLFALLAMPVHQAAPDWQAAGTLLECCTCNVPCTCNFGQGPSPYDYCHSVYAYRIKTARYDGVTLDGLVFGGADGPKGASGFLDDRATSAQLPALRKLALAVFRKGGPAPGQRQFTTTAITVSSDARKFSVDFKGSGGFAAAILIGGDGKSPIVVENNTTWPVHRFLKGKTTTFAYSDTAGNRLDYSGRNANLGEFQLSGKEPAKISRLELSAKPNCCADRHKRRSR